MVAGHGVLDPWAKKSILILSELPARFIAREVVVPLVAGSCTDPFPMRKHMETALPGSPVQLPDMEKALSKVVFAEISTLPKSMTLFMEKLLHFKGTEKAFSVRPMLKKIRNIKYFASF
jgi:hypothetical protein